MEYTTQDLKLIIDDMVIERKSLESITEFIETHANGNAELLRDWVHKRRDDVGEFLTDAGNGEAFAFMWKHKVRYVYEFGKWIIYHDGRWMLDKAQLIRNLAVKTLRTLCLEVIDTENSDVKKKQQKLKWLTDSESDKHITAMLKHAASQPGMTVTADQLDNKPWLLNVKNGTIDLHTCELRPAKPEELLTQQIPINYNPEATAAEWEAFLLRIFDRNTTLVDYIQRGIGYTINGTQSERAFFFLFGTGKNGKSQLMKALRVVLHPYSYEAKPEMFLAKRFNDSGPDEAQAALYRVRLLTAAEIKPNQSLDVSLIKRMTGGEEIHHERKYEHAFNYMPTHTLWLSGNHEPRIKDNTDSIWDRLNKIEFSIQIPPEEQIGDYGIVLAEKYPEAILNWCVKGATAWKQRGLKDKPESVKAANYDYRARQDILHDFIGTIEKDDDFNTLVKDMYTEYTNYCRENNDESMNKVEFNNAMREHGFRDKELHANKKYWIGIRVRPVSRVRPTQENFLYTRAREETFTQETNPANPTNPINPCPDKPCHTCGSSNWWLRGNEWLCGRCHPKPEVINNE